MRALIVQAPIKWSWWPSKQQYLPCPDDYGTKNTEMDTAAKLHWNATTKHTESQGLTSMVKPGASALGDRK